MAKIILDETLTAIADSIRTKTGTTQLIKPKDMPSRIQSIKSLSDVKDGEVIRW